MESPADISADFLLDLSAENQSSSSSSSSQCEDMNSFLWADRRDLTTRSTVMAIFAALYSTIIFLGLLGNACVIVAIARIRSLQTVPNMFIFSLSCSDMLVCCISATITPITAFRKDWIFGQFLCSFAPFIAGVSLCFSTFTLAAISVDRFLLILFPTRKAFSHGQAMIIILVICLLASGFSLPMLFMQKLKPVANYCGQFCFEDWGQNHGTRRIYGTLMLTVQFIIPLALITFCYTAISVRLGKSVNLRSKKKECEWQMPISAQRNAATKRRQRTNRMFIAMTLAFSLSWGWSVLYNLLRDYDGLPHLVLHQEFFFGILTHCIAMSSTVWNPILYALLNLQLRAAFLQLIPQCLKDSIGRIFGQKRKEGGIGQQNSVEENRLLATNKQNGATRNGGRRQGSVESKKWLTCFLNSSGSVESSTSDPRPNLLLLREEEEDEKQNVPTELATERRGNQQQRKERYGSCLTELEEQTWNGPNDFGIGEREEEEEEDGEMDENI